MKKLIVCLLFLTSCKDQPASDDEKSVVSLLQQAGCTATKHQGKVTISCADGSNADITTAPVVSAFYPRDDFQEYPNLRYVSSQSPHAYFMNTVTGNILDYNNGVLSGPLYIYFDGANCTGNMFLNTGPAFANMVFPNQASVPGAQGLKISFTRSPTTTIQSQSMAVGGCQPFSQTGSNYYAVTAVPFNEQAPAQIIPLSLVIEK